MSQEANGPLTVLLVDDSEVFLEAARSWIATRPSLRLVATARDGAEALARLEREKVSLVLMDAFMPVMDGFEATRRIKSAEGSPAVIIVSVHEGTAVEQEAWAAGADAFLPKSEFSDRLPGLIREVLAGGRSRAAAAVRPRRPTGVSLPNGGTERSRSDASHPVLGRWVAAIRRLAPIRRTGPETVVSPVVREVQSS